MKFSESRDLSQLIITASHGLLLSFQDFLTFSIINRATVAYIVGKIIEFRIVKLFGVCRDLYYQYLYKFN